MHDLADLRSTTIRLVHDYRSSEHGETACLTEVLAHLGSDHADAFTRDNAQGHMTSSALVLSPDCTRVLLIHHRFLDLWLQPGGHYEPPGTLWDSARREVAEETGVTDIAMHPAFAATGLPLDIDSHPIPARPARHEPAHWHHDLCFLAVAHSHDALSAQADEVHDARWVPVASLASMSNLRMARLGRKVEILLG